MKPSNLKEEFEEKFGINGYYNKRFNTRHEFMISDLIQMQRDVATWMADRIIKFAEQIETKEGCVTADDIRQLSKSLEEC